MGEAPASKSHILALAKQTVVYGIGGIALQAVGVITLPIFARVFSTTQYGVLELGVTLSAVALAFVDAGFASAAQRSFYDYSAEQEDARRRVVSTAFTATTIVGVVAALVLVATRDRVSLWLFGDESQTNVVIAAAISIPLINSANFLREAMRLRFRAWHYVASSIVGSFGAAAIAIVAVVGFDAGVVGYFAGLIFGSALALFYGLYVVRVDVGGGFSGPELRIMLAYGIPLVPAAFALWALSLADRVLLSHLADLEAVGEYAVANRVANVLLLVVTGFALAFGPYIFSVYSEDRDLERAVRAQTLRYLVIGLCLIGLALTLFAREIIAVAAPAFTSAYKAVGLLELGVVAYGISSVVMSGISYVRRTEILAALAVIAAGINIGLNFVLIPRYGMVGAALATAAAYGLLALAQYAIAQRLYPTPYEATRILRIVALASALGTLGVVPLHPLVVALLVKTAALAAFAGGLRLVGGIDGDDVLKLRDLAGRIRRVRPLAA